MTNHEANMPVAFGNVFLVINCDTIWLKFPHRIISHQNQWNDGTNSSHCCDINICLFNFIHKLFPNRSKLKIKLEVHLLWQVNPWPLTLMVSQLAMRLQIRTHCLVSKSQKVAEVFSNSQPRLRTRKTNGDHKFLEIHCINRSKKHEL